MAHTITDSHMGKDLREYQTLKVLDGVGEGTSDVIDARLAQAVSLIVDTGTGVSGGTVLLEGSPVSTYSGTWISLGSITSNAQSKLFGASVGLGATSGFPVRYVRARISSNIVGGTASAYLVIHN